MLRRNRRILTPEETERAQREGVPGSSVAPTKPSLLSRLKLRRNAGEVRTTVAPPERYAEVVWPSDSIAPQAEAPRPTRVQPATETSTPQRAPARPASRAPMPPAGSHQTTPSKPAKPARGTQAVAKAPETTTRKKSTRPIRTSDAVRQLYHQEPTVEE